MAQSKPRFKLYTVAFCVDIFLLTAVGLAVLRYGGFVLLVYSAWFTLVYIGAWALSLASAVGLLIGNGKLSGKKVLVLASGVMLASTVFTHSMWTIATPRWSFSVSTDKAVYKQGEPVRIMTFLSNHGFISHSFRSASSDPVIVSVEYQYSEDLAWASQVWYSSISRSVTGFTVGVEETFERSFVWNQTNIYRPEEKIKQGIYWIRAFIPKESSGTFGFNNLFSAWTTMNITSD